VFAYKVADGTILLRHSTTCSIVEQNNIITTKCEPYYYLDEVTKTP
jgi:hypothetical protein